MIDSDNQHKTPPVWRSQVMTRDCDSIENLNLVGKKKGSLSDRELIQEEGNGGVWRES